MNLYIKVDNVHDIPDKCHVHYLMRSYFLILGSLG